MLLDLFQQSSHGITRVFHLAHISALLLNLLLALVLEPQELPTLIM